jgi:hypothetical protein
VVSSVSGHGRLDARGVVVVRAYESEDRTHLSPVSPIERLSIDGGADEGWREGARPDRVAAPAVDGADFDVGAPDEVGLLRGQEKGAALAALLLAGTVGHFSPLADARRLVIGAHGEGMVEGEDAGGGVVIDPEEPGGGVAAFFIATDDEGDGLAAVMDFVLGEERFARKFVSEGIAKGRDVAGEEDGFDALGGAGFGPVHAHDRGRGVGALDDESGEDAGAGLPRGDDPFFATRDELVAAAAQSFSESFFRRFQRIDGEAEGGDVVFGIAHRADREGITSKKGSSSLANSPVAVRDSGLTLSGRGCW